MITKEQFKAPRKGNDEPTRVVVIRLPKSMHEEMKRAAHHYETSLNQLCLASFAETLRQKEESQLETINVRIAE